jgi:lipase
VALYVHEWGDPDGPPLVCVHGVTGYGGRFRRLAEERWGDRFRVVAPDLRGHGRSTWEPPWTIPAQLESLLHTVDELGIDRADWVGHSWGGRLVLELAAARPERMRRAVLLDPAIQPLPGPALQLAEGELAGGVYASVEDLVEQRLAASALTPRAEVERDAAEHFEQLPDGRLRRHTSQPAAVSVYGELVAPPPPPETLAGIPTLLLHAPAFGLVREEQVDAYAAALGDGLRIVEVPGGHMVMWDAFEETATAVEDFLSDRAPPGARAHGADGS